MKSCHRNGVRFFIDVVMAFATRWSYETVNFLDFHVHRGTGDPEEDDRQDFGGALFKYGFRTEGYDPISGERRSMVPARRIMLAHLSRWLLDFRADGILPGLSWVAGGHGPGLATPVLSRVKWTGVPRPIWPLDPDMTWRVPDDAAVA